MVEIEQRKDGDLDVAELERYVAEVRGLFESTIESVKIAAKSEGFAPAPEVNFELRATLHSGGKSTEIRHNCLADLAFWSGDDREVEK